MGAEKKLFSGSELESESEKKIFRSPSLISESKSVTPLITTLHLSFEEELQAVSVASNERSFFLDKMNFLFNGRKSNTLGSYILVFIIIHF